MRTDAVDLFAGPGGWDVAARDLGLDVLGIEWDHAACETRRAAHLRTIEGDVRAHDPRDFEAEGLIASPPCQTFSNAGAGFGKDRTEAVVAAVLAWDFRAHFGDDRTGLILEPLRWILTMAATERPYRWIAMEQVPTCLPVWDAYADVLARLGYSVVTGFVHSEQFGTPQTRKRAALIASLDAPVQLPEPTHSKYHQNDRMRMDSGVLPWVSLRDAIGRTDVETPAPTVAGDPRLAPRGCKHPKIGCCSANRDGKLLGRQFPVGTIRVSPAEAGVLQGFPADYPWQGTVAQQHQQSGNAIPPPLAAAVLAVATRVTCPDCGDPHAPCGGDCDCCKAIEAMRESA